jgi:dihydroxyacetone kinase
MIICFGKGQVGDKTMIDAVVPVVDDLTEGVGAGRSLREAWRQAATVAEAAAQQTVQLAATLGRARSHGDKSIGTPDPGGGVLRPDLHHRGRGAGAGGVRRRGS